MSGEQLVGRTIAGGRYEIVRLLGEGGMGAVYQARQVAMDRMVALKLILAELVRSPAAAARFHREMKLTAKIEHPNTIRVYDFGETEGQLFLTMELLRGVPMSSALAEAGRFDLPRIVRIATQVARALAAAHSEGVVHRDLKPDNVMLIEQYGERDVVKVLDFGIAKSLDQEDTGMTSTGAVVGTPAYMSAEQAMGQAVDQRSDLYSLGVMLYEMASGRVPFQAPALTAMLVAHATETPAPLMHTAPDVHPGLSALVDELLRKDPAARPQTAKLVEQRLDALLGGGRAGAGMQQPQQSYPQPQQSYPQQPVHASPTPQPMHPPLPLPQIAPTYPVAHAAPKPSSSSGRGLWFALVAVVVIGGGITAAVLGSGGGGSGSGSAGQTGSGVQALAGSEQTATDPAGKTAAGSGKTVERTGSGTSSGSGSGAGAGSSQPASGTDAAARLAAATQKLAGFGDPPLPAACPPPAAAEAAELILAAREAITADKAKALETADRALAQCPSAAAAHNIRGNALSATGKLDDAADAYARALQFAPDYEAPRFNLGVVQLRRRDPAAIATFTEILRRKPDDPSAHKSRAQAYAIAKRYAEAAEDLEASLAKEPDDGKAWLVLGDVRTQLHRADAREAYCKAAALHVSDAARRCKK
jgi:serine/threonine-protein kinase